MSSIILMIFELHFQALARHKKKKFRKETHLFCLWFCFGFLKLLSYAK